MKSKNGKKRILIVGAGVAGRQILKEIRQRPSSSYWPVGFIDDNPKKQGLFIKGMKVLGFIREISQIAKAEKIDEILIAIPSGSGRLIRDVINYCQDGKVKFKIVPRVLEIVEGRAKLQQVREVEPQDLLGRVIAKTNLEPVKKIIYTKSILITGAAGSIGSEIVRQVAIFKPKVLVCLDWWENGLYDLELELRKKFPKGSFKFIVANIQDIDRVGKCLEKFKVDVIFHAAAYKHVPLMEENPTEAVKNNIFATHNLAKLAIKHGVNKFLFLSTDKVVNPVSIMGATKLLAENILNYFSKMKKTKFITVRFCNVLDSFGSVIPIFKKQILDGGPVTLTDKRSVRYFMTIPEAVQLIIQALTIGHGDEIFAIDSGEPIRIIDLARNLIRLYDKSSNEVEIKIVGLRPGEKIDEENLINLKEAIPTEKERIYIIKKSDMDSKRLLKCLNRLKRIVKEENHDKLTLELQGALETYRPLNYNRLVKIPKSAGAKADNHSLSQLQASKLNFQRPQVGLGKKNPSFRLGAAYPPSQKTTVVKPWMNAKNSASARFCSTEARRRYRGRQPVELHKLVTK